MSLLFNPLPASFRKPFNGIKLRFAIGTAEHIPKPLRILGIQSFFDVVTKLIETILIVVAHEMMGARFHVIHQLVHEELLSRKADDEAQENDGDAKDPEVEDPEAKMQGIPPSIHRFYIPCREWF